jgi:hypothetical protein
MTSGPVDRPSGLQARANTPSALARTADPDLIGA